MLSAERFARTLRLSQPRPFEHISLSFVPIALFFLKKPALKNDFTVFRYAETGECFALPGFKRQPRSLPGLRCPITSRGGLRHFAAPSVSRNGDLLKEIFVHLPHNTIGHRVRDLRFDLLP